MIRYAQRLWLAVLAGLLGWFAGFLASTPAMLATGWRDSEHDPHIFFATLPPGLLSWALWTMLLGGLIWLLFAVPVALLVSPAFLVRRRTPVIAATIVVATTFVLVKMVPFQDLAASHVTLRFILYMPYGTFALLFAIVTPWAYIRAWAKSLGL